VITSYIIMALFAEQLLNANTLRDGLLFSKLILTISAMTSPAIILLSGLLLGYPSVSQKFTTFHKFKLIYDRYSKCLADAKALVYLRIGCFGSLSQAIPEVIPFLEFVPLHFPFQIYMK